MSDLILEWPFVHSPKSLDEMVLHPDTRDILQKVMDTPGVMSIMLSGGPGVGKGTFLDIYLKDLLARRA